MPRGSTLRVLLGWPFRLHWSTDNWAHATDTQATSPGPGLYFADIPAPAQPGSIVFTFFWTDSQRWQNIDYRVTVP